MSRYLWLFLPFSFGAMLLTLRPTFDAIEPLFLAQGWGERAAEALAGWSIFCFWLGVVFLCLLRRIDEKWPWSR